MTTSPRLRRQLKSTRKKHAHPSRNCTEPTSPLPWMLLAGTLPASLLIIVTLISLTAGIYGYQIADLNPYHIVRDSWLKMAATCPVVVNAQSRDQFVTAKMANQRTDTTYDSFGENDALAIHKGLFQAGDNTGDIQWSVNQTDQVMCVFHDWISNTTHTRDMGSVSEMLAFTKNKQCVAGMLYCQGGIVLNKALVSRDNVRITRAEGVVVITESVDYVPAYIHTHQTPDIIYIQVKNSLTLLCQQSEKSEGPLVYTLSAGDAARMTKDTCNPIIAHNVGGISVGILMNNK